MRISMLASGLGWGLMLLLALPVAAQPDEAKTRKKFEARFPTAKIEQFNRTPFAGLYEVVFDGQVVYTDDKLNYLITSTLFIFKPSWYKVY